MSAEEETNDPLNLPSTGNVLSDATQRRQDSKARRKDPRKGSIPSRSVLSGAPSVGGTQYITAGAEPTALTHSQTKNAPDLFVDRRERTAA